MERVSRGMRTALIKTAPFLWVASAVFALLDFDTDGRTAVVLCLMALAGTVLGAMRERDDQDKRILVATIERLTRDDSLLPALRRVR